MSIDLTKLDAVQLTTWLSEDSAEAISGFDHMTDMLGHTGDLAVGPWVLVDKAVYDAFLHMHGSEDLGPVDPGYEEPGYEEPGEPPQVEIVVQRLLPVIARRPRFPTNGDRNCQDCGADNARWFAPSKLWNLVMGGPQATDDPGGVVCIPCFIGRAEAAGVKTSAWFVATDAYETTEPKATT